MIIEYETKISKLWTGIAIQLIMHNSHNILFLVKINTTQT
jgi:hypothetical protein